MASKSKSRWDDDDDPDALAQRRREKEEKKRVREEKLRRAAETRSTEESNPVNGDPEGPAKRRKISVEPEPNPQGPRLDGKDSGLLTFPGREFGPCRDVELYQHLNSIEEGSYGMVSRARTKSSGEIVALKRLKMDYINDGFPVTSLREIQTLMASRHPNVVRLREVVLGDGSPRE